MTSRLQNDVSEAMNRMDVPHVVEGMTEDGCFSIDIMLSQARIAVEVDGIHHFACNSRRPMGMARSAPNMPCDAGGALTAADGLAASQPLPHVHIEHISFRNGFEHQAEAPACRKHTSAHAPEQHHDEHASA